MHRRVNVLLAASLFVVVAGGCGAPPRGPDSGLVPREPPGGWISLFDTRTLIGWHTYQQSPGVTTGWTVDSGMIRTDGNGRDLVSDQQYSSFELELEWRAAPGANSGIFYWANEGTEEIYENAPEMQVLDNAGHPDGKSPLTAAGSLYALYPAPISAAKPAGEWNSVRIVAHGSHVQQWLNGIKVVDVNFDSKAMTAKIAASKFNQWLTFGKSRRGHIGLQSHGGTVWFRNLRIKDKS